MLKFIKYHMASISHIEIYPLVSFLIFFLFFVVMLFWVIKTDKKFINRMQNLPLEDSISETTDEYESAR